MNAADQLRRAAYRIQGAMQPGPTGTPPVTRVIFRADVALAVADWLESEADEQEILGDPPAPNVTPSGESAYALARRILGESA